MNFLKQQSGQKRDKKLSDFIKISSIVYRRRMEDLRVWIDVRVRNK